MSITSPGQFKKLRACGMIVGKALRADGRGGTSRHNDRGTF